jgi:hypothetical protein
VLVLLRAVDWGRIHNTSRANVIPDGASYCCSFIFGPNMKAGGAPRARSHCRFLLPLIHLIIPDLLTYSAPLFLKRQCDRTLGAPAVNSLRYPILDRSLRGLVYTRAPGSLSHTSFSFIWRIAIGSGNGTAE